MWDLQNKKMNKQNKLIGTENNVMIVKWEGFGGLGEKGGRD